MSHTFMPMQCNGILTHKSIIQLLAASNFLFNAKMIIPLASTKIYSQLLIALIKIHMVQCWYWNAEKLFTESLFFSMIKMEISFDYYF